MKVMAVFEYNGGWSIFYTHETLWTNIESELILRCARGR